MSNCTLRSWSSGVRIGWTNDGVIRDCTCLSLPYLCGRDGGAIENVSFNDCVFEQCKESDFPQNRKQHGAVLVGKPDEPMKNVINLEYNNTRFVVR